MEIAFSGSNRLGRLLILHEKLRTDRPWISALFGICTLLHSEEHESGRGMAFIVACDAFDEIPEGGEIPDYRIEAVYDQAFENPEWQARRVDSGRFGFAFFRKIVVRVPPASVGMQPRGASLH